MKRFKGGETVDIGLYFNLRECAFKSVDEKGPLPGAEDDVYRRVPMLLLLLVGPVLGLVYVMFLPFVGIALVTWLLGVKAAHLVGSAARETVRVLTPGWEPSMAFLSRSKPAKPERAGTDEWAEEMRKKLKDNDRGAA
jgi:hypothetical protein